MTIAQISQTEPVERSNHTPSEVRKLADSTGPATQGADNALQTEKIAVKSSWCVLLSGSSVEVA